MGGKYARDRVPKQRTGHPYPKACALKHYNTSNEILKTRLSFCCIGISLFSNLALKAASEGRGRETNRQGIC
jgi:hypothetical protein